MLHELRELVASVAKAALALGSSSLFSEYLSNVVAEAWLLNVEIVFNHFDTGFTQLYVQLHLEGCSIGLPYATISVTRQWLKALESQQMNNTVMPVASSRENAEDNLVERQKMLQSLLAPRMDTSPPQDYEMLRASSIAVVLRQCHSVMNKDSIANNHDRAAIQILPTLIKARILEQARVAMDQSVAAKGEATMVLRSDAGILASAVRSLIEMKAQHRSDRVEALLGAVEGVRSLVVLREYAFGGTDPQVIREMWLLEDALTAAGERVKARGIRQSVLHRLEKYTLDVPRGFV